MAGAGSAGACESVARGQRSAELLLPFRRLEPHHENQLTRALLVVLRYSPLAHAAWLRLAVPGRELYQLAAAVFRTQTRAVRYAEDTDEPAELVSVFLTPEAPLTGGAVLTESDRTQVLDAVIDYGGELLVVVENKVAEDDDLQARELNMTGARVRLADGQDAVVVLWRDVIEALIALRERHLVAGAEALLLDDFLTHVEDCFPALGPFRTLGLARGNRYRHATGYGASVGGTDQRAVASGVLAALSTAVRLTLATDQRKRYPGRRAKALPTHDVGRTWAPQGMRHEAQVFAIACQEHPK